MPDQTGNDLNAIPAYFYSDFFATIALGLGGPGDAEM